MTESAIDSLRGTRIAHLIETDGPGGAERVLSLIAGGFQEAGCPGVAFLPAGHHGWLSGELSAQGIWIEYFNLDRAFSPSFVQWLSGAFREYDIGMAHSHEFAMGVYGSWAARRAGIGHLITLHGSRYYAERVRRRVALRTAAMLSGGIVAVSREYARQIARDLWMPRSRVITVLNGVPAVAAGPSTLRQELGIGPSDPIALSLGRLYPVKGHAILLTAMARLSPRHPRLHLVIAGSGHLAESLAQQAGQLGVGGRVHFLGMRDDVANLLNAANLFVLPSLSEGLPMAMLEAMFAAVPIVATDVGEVRETLADGVAGVIVPPGDADAIADAMDAVLKNGPAACAMGRRAAQRAAQHFSLDAMLDRYARLYQERLPATRHTPGALTAV